MYTLGEPGAKIRTYLDWILSDEGQAILARSGYVPLKAR
jgi:ABC-type phosphate transport system substrate-binding protein